MLLFSVLAGVGSGVIAAAAYMPAYSYDYNVRRWAPGCQEEVQVLGAVGDVPGSLAIYAADWEELRLAGFSPQRLWRFDEEAAAEQVFALVGHGIWRKQRLRPGDAITVLREGEPLTVPVAGVWHPFHPQLGDDWLVLVGKGVPAGASRLETLGPAPVPAFVERFGDRSYFFWLMLLAAPLYGVRGRGHCRFQERLRPAQLGGQAVGGGGCRSGNGAGDSGCGVQGLFGPAPAQPAARHPGRNGGQLPAGVGAAYGNRFSAGQGK